MKSIKTLLLTVIAIAITACTAPPESPSVDPLPSWNDGPTKSAIIKFVESATNNESEHFIAVADRIAVFDNDGNLWSEQPAYFQLFFVIDRVKELAPLHPE